MTTAQLLDASWETRERFPEVIAVSPDGRLLAAQWGRVDGAGHAAVWDVATRRIVWEPEGVTSLCWVRGQVLATRFDRETRREVIDAYDPGTRRRVATFAIRYPGGAWLTHAPLLVASPSETMVAVRWLEQSEAGFELLQASGDAWAHVPSWGDRIPCNITSRPAFSDDSAYLAMVWANPRDPFEWWKHVRSDGSHLAGVLAVMRTSDAAVGNLPYFVRLAEHWKPDPRRSPAPEVVGFAGDQLEVELQTGERVRRSVTEAELTIPISPTPASPARG